MTLELISIHPPGPLPRTATPWVLPQPAWGTGVGGTGASGGLTSPLAPGLFLHSTFTWSLQCLWQHSPQSGGNSEVSARGPVCVLYSSSPRVLDSLPLPMPRSPRQR